MTMTVFSLSFMTSPAVGMERGSALTAVIIGSVCGVVATPLGGLAADRFGARNVLAFGSLLGAAGAFPLFAALSSGSTVAATVAIAVGYGVVIACTSGSQGAYLAGLFPAAERFSGIALAREANGAIVAGFTPLIAAALITATGGQDLWSSASPRQTAASRLQGRAGPPYIYVGLHHSHLFPPYSPLRRDAPPKDNQLTYQCRSIRGRQESSTTRTRSSSMKVDASEPHLDYGTGCSINIRTVRSQVQDRPATPVPGPYLDSGYHCL